ncbi:MAG: hypothetical protein ACYDHY_05845 [Acidiferrobacterales bacterium]
MDKPKIITALPQCRYKLGAFLITVLGEVESGDGVSYRYIAAVITEGDPEPGLYVTSERAAGSSGHTGKHAMRIIMRDGAQVIGTSDRWGNLDMFVSDALEVVARLLDLQDEQPYPLS